MSDNNIAPGWPGIPPRWTSSAKTGVGTALNPESRVWFTLSHGILNEVYFPRVDKACIRDLGFLTTDGSSFFSEERRDTRSAVHTLAPGIPAYEVVNTCVQGRYRIEKTVLSDPIRHVVLQRVRFSATQGPITDYHLYALLSPHLANCGSDNTAWVGDYKGVPMLMAEHNGDGLALASSVPWRGRSAGFVGYSDGWQDISRNKSMTWFYSRAENGNVALVGEIDLRAGNGEFVLALGFGGNSSEAAQHALASLMDGFNAAADQYVEGWQRWQETLISLTIPQPADLYRISASVLRTHESKAFPGGIIASLSIPWGNTKGDNDLGGYHLVWPRDLVETAGGLLAAGARTEALSVLRYLQATQEGDGHWSQNMWLDGSPYWNGIQMDETAFPILLTDLLHRSGALEDGGLSRFWPMVRRAASYIACNGPVTQQDRWEEDPGYSPFTLAAEIVALLVAADLAEVQGEADVAAYLRDTADNWNDSIERWVYCTGSDLARSIGVEGYYVRVAPQEEADAASPNQGFVPIKNRPPGQSEEPSRHIVSPDFLALVRFGLRAADDPRILNTLKIVDALLKVEMPQGPLWHRYNDDGYGEHEDGSAFDGTGIGRAWPLLSGERAHYELAAGHKQEAERLLRTMECSADPGGMISEQCWDAPAIPERELLFGRPSGSARPLVWAHAEHVKLVRSLRDGHVFDCPPQAVERYIEKKTVSPLAIWRKNNKVHSVEPGKILRIELLSPAVVHWTTTDWNSVEDVPTRDTGLGVYWVDVPANKIGQASTVQFTFFFPDDNHWEGLDYSVRVEKP